MDISDALKEALYAKVRTRAPLESRPVPENIKPQTRQETDEKTRILLGERFPAVFGRRPVPLQTGIHKAIWERCPDIQRLSLRRFLWGWTHRLAYFAAVSRGGMRFDLDGQPCEPISEAHQADALRDAEAIAKVKRMAYQKKRRETQKPQPKRKRKQNHVVKVTVKKQRRVLSC